MEYLLVVVFFVNGVDNQGQFIDGFMPLQMETYQECEERRKFFDNQLSTTPGVPEYHLACYKMEDEGIPM